VYICKELFAKHTLCIYPTVYTRPFLPLMLHEIFRQIYVLTNIIVSSFRRDSLELRDFQQLYAYHYHFQAVPKKVKVGERVNVKVSFTNSLPKDLTECMLSVEGVGLQRPREIIIPGYVILHITIHISKTSH